MRDIDRPDAFYLGRRYDLEGQKVLDELQLALALNNLLASPSFSAWVTGEPLSLQTMLHGPDGRPRQAVFSLAHLDDSQRMFFLSLLLEEVLTWTRGQTGTTGLRAICFIDEYLRVVVVVPGVGVVVPRVGGRAPVRPRLVGFVRVVGAVPQRGGEQVPDRLGDQALREGRAGPPAQNHLTGHVVAGSRSPGHGRGMTAVCTHARPETVHEQLLAALADRAAVADVPLRHPPPQA